MAEKLDEADGKKDGKIDASVWNSYLDSVGSKGNKIKESINVNSAVKSLNFYDSKKDVGTVNWKNWEADYEKFMGNQSGLEEVELQHAPKAPVTGPKRGENPAYDAAVSSQNPPLEEVELQRAPSAPVTGPKRGENPAYDAAVSGQNPPLEEVELQRAPSAPVTGPKRGENPAYDAAVSGQNPPLEEVELQRAPSAPVTGPKRGENPAYDAAVSGQNPPLEEVELQRAPSAPVTGPKKGENPTYDAIVSGQYKPETEEAPAPTVATQPTQPSVAPQTTPPEQEQKNYTKAEIQQNIDNLKPGESFSFQRTIRFPGFMESYPVTWTRGEDGTLKETTRKITLSANRQVVEQNTVYTPDGKQKISEDFLINNSIPRAATKHYDSNGNVSSVTMNLENINNIGKKEIGGLDNLGKMIYVAKRSSATCAEQTFTDKNGKALVTCKDGKFYNAKGKEISDGDAYELLEKSLNKGELKEFTQIPAPKVEE